MATMRALIVAAAKSGGNDSARPTSQVAVIKASVRAPATTIRSVPAGSESEPGLAAIKASAEQFTAPVDSVSPASPPSRVSRGRPR
jgi:hypothetical protein